jgi:hypothetical protein
MNHRRSSWLTAVEAAVSFAPMSLDVLRVSHKSCLRRTLLACGYFQLNPITERVFSCRINSSPLN